MFLPETIYIQFMRPTLTLATYYPFCMKVGPYMAPKSSAQSSTVNAEQLNAFKIFSSGWNENFIFFAKIYES